MATNPIIISSFQWGLANDRNSWPAGAFWDAQGIEIRKNSTYCTLNRGVANSFTTWTAKINAIALTNYNGWTLEQEINVFCNNWKVYEDSVDAVSPNDWNEIYKYTENTGWLEIIAESNFVNVLYVPITSTTIAWYNYLFWENNLYRFQSSVRENILATDTFSSGWTGTNWSVWVHTAGSTVAYTQSAPLVTIVWEVYHVIVYVNSQSAWTCTVWLGWATAIALAVGRNDLYFRATTTAWIVFTPSSASTIDMRFVRVDRVSDLATSNWLWVKKIWALTSGKARRPVINFLWDLIIGDGNQIARYNRDGTIILFSSTVWWPVIGGLDGTVYAITAIGTNIYVWCNNGGATNMYIWDGVSERPSQKVTYPDKPVINVALLNNQHYWWTEKWPLSQKSVMVWEGYQAQRYITSDIPKAIATETLDDPDRLALLGTNTNAIETFWDVVYMPWYGKIYWFGNYFPGQSKAFNKEFTFSGSECTAMLTTSTPTLGQDYTFYMLIAYKDLSSNYQVGIIDFRDYNWSYVSDWYLETMEYLGGNLWFEKNQKKLLVPFYLPHSSTSIEVYERKNQASSYTLIKTINTTDYWTGFNVAEIADSGKWNTIQWKFKLITSDTTYSPRLYVGITDILLDTANRNG